jgi:4'-phosphopantetheinyl transferase EntD
MRFQFAFPAVVAASLLGFAAPAFAQGTGDYAAPIPPADIRAGQERADEYLSGRYHATTGAVSALDQADVQQPASIAPRRRHPVKKPAQ